MTISLTDNNPRISYTVNAGATQTSFTVPFEFFDIADLNVYVDGTQKSATTHYTVSSGGSGSTGTIALSVTGASGNSTVVITRDIDLARTTDFPTSGSFNIAALNTELDKVTAQFADRKDDVDRSLRLQDSDAAASMELPLKAARLGTVLGFNASTGVPEAGPTIADVSSLSAITADIAALADIEDGTTATDAISGLAAIKANVTTVAGVASNVTSVAGNASNINAAVSNASNINTVAGKESEITSVAAKASLITSDFVSDLNTVAVTDVINDLNTLATSDFVADLNLAATSDFISDLNTMSTTTNVNNLGTVAGAVSNVNTVAGIASDVSTVAGISSDVAAVENIASNVTSVAGNASNINTVASNISTISAKAPAEGSSNIVTTGALNSGSITSGFGAIDNGSSAITTTGVITGGTVEATTDTASGDNAAMGYTAAEGLILTGQGSTNDVTIKNDADADVLEIPTGTTDVTVVGNVTAGGTVSGAHALSHRNMILNGAFQIAQRGTTSTGVGADGISGYHNVDRWRIAIGSTSAGRVSMTQTAVTDLAGFSKSMKIQCTTADTSIAAGERLLFQSRQEGNAVQRLKASSTSTNAFTLSFYARSNATRAVVTEILFSNGTNRAMSTLHNITTSWARYTMTVPAASSTQIDDDNSLELSLNIILHAGSDSTSGTLNNSELVSYTAANRAVGVGSIFASTDNFFEITGVQLELGSVATPFEHRSFADDLLACQRYLRLGGAGSYGIYNGSTNIEISEQFNPNMRAAPSLSMQATSISISNKSNSNTATAGSATAVNISASASGAFFAQIGNCDVTSASAGHIAQFRTAEFLRFDAEI